MTFTREDVPNSLNWSWVIHLPILVADSKVRQQYNRFSGSLSALARIIWRRFCIFSTISSPSYPAWINKKAIYYFNETDQFYHIFFYWGYFLNWYLILRERMQHVKLQSHFPRIMYIKVNLWMYQYKFLKKKKCTQKNKHLNKK